MGLFLSERFLFLNQYHIFFRLRRRWEAAMSFSEVRPKLSGYSMDRVHNLHGR